MCLEGLLISVIGGSLVLLGMLLGAVSGAFALFGFWRKKIWWSRALMLSVVGLLLVLSVVVGINQIEVGCFVKPHDHR